MACYKSALIDLERRRANKGQVKIGKMNTKSANLINNIKRNNADEWGTPVEFFEALDNEFKFTLDVCANSKEIAKCERFFTIEQNGLIQDWSKDICFMNPPYSKTIEWMKKAHEESLKGSLVVALTFAKTDTKWFHEYAYKHEIRFIRGRLKFVNFNEVEYKNECGAPFGSMITIFRQPDRLRRVDTGNSEAIVGSANIDEIAESSRND